MSIISLESLVQQTLLGGEEFIDEDRKDESSLSDYLNSDNICAYEVDGTNGCLPKHILEEISKTSAVKNNPRVAKKYRAFIEGKSGNMDQFNLFFDSALIEECGGTAAVKRFSKYFKPVAQITEHFFSNHEENSVLLCIENVDPKFIAIPVQTMDFYAPGYGFGDKLSGFFEQNIEAIKAKTKNKAGCVLNTMSTQTAKSGKGTIGHWVAMFMDFRPSTINTIEYYNSSGNPAIPEVMDWMKELAVKFQNATGIKTEARNVSGLRSQNSRTECGAYSLYFIMARQSGVCMKRFREKKIPDKVVTNFRSSIVISGNDVENKEIIDQSHYIRAGYY